MIVVIVRFPKPIDGRHEETNIPIGGVYVPARIYPEYYEPSKDECMACDKLIECSREDVECPLEGIFRLRIFIDVSPNEFDPLTVIQSVESYVEWRWGKFEFIRMIEK